MHPNPPAGSDGSDTCNHPATLQVAKGFAIPSTVPRSPCNGAILRNVVEQAEAPLETRQRLSDFRIEAFVTPFTFSERSRGPSDESRKIAVAAWFWLSLIRSRGRAASVPELQRFEPEPDAARRQRSRTAKSCKSGHDGQNATDMKNRIANTGPLQANRPFSASNRFIRLAPVWSDDADAQRGLASLPVSVVFTQVFTPLIRTRSSVLQVVFGTSN